ncbi:dCTP deaminase/dUTPase family protein [Pantoea ananatis]|uniref:hypothetical protein n=1 Tax=Pantoea ananas TaxID=553 RepID=UPI000DA6B813|nr:hypothetical protein [Pantoea ananatis]PZD60672.1 hypothetical protein ARC272_17870 [Pantoea ananatis]
MQLNSLDAIRLGYVRDKHGKLLDPSIYNKTSSVDITIGEVLFKTENGLPSNRKVTTLKPQESLVIISEEIVHVPPDHVAYVFLKNTLSLRGLLALNTGIIDANYNGPISTVIINFSNEDATIPFGDLKEDKDFFRVVFHKINSSVSTVQVPQQIVSFSTNEYETYKQGKVESLKKLPKTFLESKALEKKIHDQLFKKISEFSISKLLASIAVIGVLFTALPMLKDWIFSMQYDVKDSIITQTTNKLKIENLETDVEKLKEQIRTLELKPNNRNKSR